MGDKKDRICPVEHSGSLDSNIRKWLQNPRKILGQYIREGMIVLDIGCGPGFFSIDMAEMVGATGRVIAADLQEGMLQKVRNKVNGTNFERRIRLHRCDEDKIGISEQVDFVLLFYMVHEIPDKDAFFKQIEAILKPNGQVLMVEPPFHVSKAAFKKTVQKARDAGLSDSEGPKIFLSKTVVLTKRCACSTGQRNPF